jgi:hypothetical protein
MRKHHIKKQINRGALIQREAKKAFLSTKETHCLDEVRSCIKVIAPCVKNWLKHSNHSCHTARVTPLNEKSSEMVWTEFAYFSDRIMAPHRLCFLLELCEKENR